MSENPAGASAGAACRPGDPGFAARYRAIDARDTRFDGQFYTAVSSTGIYCRPSCPARTPAERHVTFYGSAAAAQIAGFRACKRCVPEAVPGTPEWNLRGDLAGRAMRLIADGVVDREGVDGLAATLGFTSRHVARILTEQLGAGPLALARARRAQTARALLVGTDLDIAQVAFASGFGSIRQFNTTILEVFAQTPGALRGRARPVHPERAAGEAVRISLELPTRAPYDAPGVFAFLAARAIAGVEAVDLADSESLRYARTLRLPGGPAAVEVHADSGMRGWRLRAELELSDLADLATALSRLRRLLDLDADPEAVDAALSRDQHLAPLVAAVPGARVPGTADAHETVIRALVGQQISVAAARTHLGRIVAALGQGYTSRFAGLSALFPTMRTLAAGIPAPEPGVAPDPERILRLPGRQVQTVRATAAALAEGDLVVHVGAEGKALRKALTDRPGIGPWTAGYIAMRVLGDPDAWLDRDVALLAGARALGLGDPAQSAAAAHRDLAETARAWAPWRSYAVMHLWRVAAR
ncbi:AraC family transcriptional regulator of adaptative response / DNA-3-methyladenine glycosylase II [Mycetocola sp. BIGb0189]|uniref:AlkA N-terminal domain-containing protein n=1 Tax=Mycetocola sp. BIGb0189 TaxID=2940604 RepID=UPI0021685792|nr:AlkA N-terminal domain-containing protein [Mycetocola sp. BIGb0189]MCS4276485.1 AraC family transcriptional regulator of adaptative response / DNA-3-methyladenine glycosylase II [Mycetocola sp. BIGb0189]